jgi:hypothetical protein
LIHKPTRFSFVLPGGAPTLSRLKVIRARNPVMPAQAALKRVPEPTPEPKTRLFHARMVVTRVEEWCVEAQTPEEARALLVSGAGHRCTPGESVQIELDSLLD